jgi:hypothetical protein
MVDTNELENYLNDKNAKAGDVVTIIGAGSIETKADQTGKMKKNLNLPVEINGYQLIYSPGKTARKPLEDAYGTNTTKWIGKQFKVSLFKMQVGEKLRDIILPVPIVTTIK